jgi:hypothetical protein
LTLVGDERTADASETEPALRETMTASRYPRAVPAQHAPEQDEGQRRYVREQSRLPTGRPHDVP